MKFLLSIGNAGLLATDTFSECLSLGAVLWTEQWIRNEYPDAPSLISKGIRLGVPVGPTPKIQLLRVGPALLEDGEGSCLELAIYEAGWRRAKNGENTVVRVGRVNGRIQAHSIVIVLDEHGEVGESIDVAALLEPTSQYQESQHV